MLHFEQSWWLQCSQKLLKYSLNCESQQNLTDPCPSHIILIFRAAATFGEERTVVLRMECNPDVAAGIIASVSQVHRWSVVFTALKLTGASFVWLLLSDYRKLCSSITSDVKTLNRKLA